jgi:hypothetical protein
LKTRGATRPRSPPTPVYQDDYHPGSARRQETAVKKLLVLLILVAIGVAVARKVREA